MPDGEPTNFSNMFVFGDSSVDVGALEYLSPDIGDSDLTARLQDALANGGTDSPVGVGEITFNTSPPCSAF